MMEEHCVMQVFGSWRSRAWTQHCKSPRCSVTHTAARVRDWNLSLFPRWKTSVTLFWVEKCSVLGLEMQTAVRSDRVGISHAGSRRIRSVRWETSDDHFGISRTCGRVPNRTPYSPCRTHGVLLSYGVVRTLLQYACGHEYKTNTALIHVCVCAHLSLEFPLHTCSLKHAVRIK